MINRDGDNNNAFAVRRHSCCGACRLNEFWPSFDASKRSHTHTHTLNIIRRAQTASSIDHHTHCSYNILTRYCIPTHTSLQKTYIYIYIILSRIICVRVSSDLCGKSFRRRGEGGGGHCRTAAPGRRVRASTITRRR